MAKTAGTLRQELRTDKAARDRGFDEREKAASQQYGAPPKNSIDSCELRSVDQKQVPHSIEDLHRSVRLTNEYLTELRQRLGCVLRAECESPDKVASCEPVPRVVEIAEHVREIESVEHNNQRIVTDILDRLEL